jgi:hypothetical protein
LASILSEDAGTESEERRANTATPYIQPIERAQPTRFDAIAAVGQP